MPLQFWATATLARTTSTVCCDLFAAHMHTRTLHAYTFGSLCTCTHKHTTNAHAPQHCTGMCTHSSHPLAHAHTKTSSDGGGHSATQTHSGLQHKAAKATDEAHQPGIHDSLTPTSPPASPTTIKLDLLQQRSDAQRETRARRIDLAWRILLPAAAESLISEFLPSAKTEAGIDLASTFANTLGAFLEGDSIDQRVAASLTHSLSLHSLTLLTPSLIHSLTNKIRVPS